MLTVPTSTDVLQGIISDIRAVEKFVTENCRSKVMFRIKANAHPVTGMKAQRGSRGITVLVL
jgi:hypothetical protein